MVFIFFTFGSVANIGRAYWLTPVFYACASLLVFPPLYPYFKKFDFLKNISIRFTTPLKEVEMLIDLTDEKKYEFFLYN